MILSCFLALVVLSGVFTASVSFHPLSDEYIDHINSLQTTWKAGRNFDKDTSINDIKRLLGVRISSNRTDVKKIRHDTNDTDIPENYDAREAWPFCESIRTIRDQSNCGSCWAVAAAAAMSDRICIASNGFDQTWVSDEDLVACCTEICFGCDGGDPYEAWKYWEYRGIASGGPYRSNFGCKAYSMEPCRHHTDIGDLPACDSLNYDTPECVKECDEGSFLWYKESKSYGSVYELYNNVEQIQLEILKHGPVEVSFIVFDDFPLYKSGVYKKTSDKHLGTHAVRMIGWGVENDVPYWLITNSWNEGWGDRGLFKISRGTDECGIETGVLAGIPRWKFSNTHFQELFS